jgi:hypothetical protein
MNDRLQNAYPGHAASPSGFALEDVAALYPLLRDASNEGWPQSFIKSLGDNRHLVAAMSAVIHFANAKFDASGREICIGVLGTLAFLRSFPQWQPDADRIGDDVDRYDFGEKLGRQYHGDMRLKKLSIIDLIILMRKACQNRETAFFFANRTIMQTRICKVFDDVIPAENGITLRAIREQHRAVMARVLNEFTGPRVTRASERKPHRTDPIVTVYDLTAAPRS